MKRYEALDSWRGICACMVVLFHFKANSHLLHLPLIRNAYLFVDFFFVLSGFIIFESYRARLQEGFGIARFMWFRLGRLYPLHVFLLAVLFVYELAWMAGLNKFSSAPREAFTQEFSPFALVANILLWNSFAIPGAYGWNYPSWSIGAEFYTYLLFSTLVVASGRRLLPGCLILVAVGLAVTAWFGGTTMRTAEELGFPRCIYGFGLGALYSLLRLNEPLKGWRQGMTARYATAFELGAVASCTAFVMLAGTSAWSYAAPLVFMTAITVFAEEKGALSRIMQLRSFKWLGKLSYSIYLTHVPVILLCANMAAIAGKVLGLELKSSFELDGRTYVGLGIEAWHGDIAYAGQLVIVLFVASYTYRWVEQPWRDRFRERWTNVTATAASQVVREEKQ